MDEARSGRGERNRGGKGKWCRFKVNAERRKKKKKVGERKVSKRE